MSKCPKWMKIYILNKKDSKANLPMSIKYRYNYRIANKIRYLIIIIPYKIKCKLNKSKIEIYNKQKKIYIQKLNKFTMNLIRKLALCKDHIFQIILVSHQMGYKKLQKNKVNKIYYFHKKVGIKIKKIYSLLIS